MLNISIPKVNGESRANKYPSKGRTKPSMTEPAVLTPASNAHYEIVSQKVLGRFILPTQVLMVCGASFSSSTSPL